MAAFERRRREAVEELIATAPEHLQARLRSLQWRIDAERRRYKHPLMSCVAIYNMMWESLYGEHGLVVALEALAGSPRSAGRDAEGNTGKVLPFRR